MKYFVGILIGILVVGGIFLGFRLGRNTYDTSIISYISSVVNPSTNSALLDFGNKGLTKVTYDVYDKKDTTELILSDNDIQSLPSEMGKMTNLVTLKIDHNVLEGSLIGEIRQMTKLRHLDVSYNDMTGVPAEIGQLYNLQILDYSYNKITGLPNELTNLKNNLKEFNLTGNPLSQDKIGKLKIELPNTDIIF